MKNWRTTVVLACGIVLLASPAWGQRPERARDTLRPGDRAPDFTLASPDGKQQVTLSAACAEKPVALVFGSYT